MGARVRLGDTALAAHLLHIGMVLSDLAQPFPVEQVSAAVPHVEDSRLLPFDECRDQRRTHAAEFRLPPRQGEHRAVCGVERRGQRLLARFFPQLTIQLGPHLLHEHLRGKAARHVASVRAAHTVAHHKQRGLARLAHLDLVNILVGRTHAPLIGQAEPFHNRTPPAS